MEKYQKYLVPFLLLILVISYTILAFLSEGTIGGADDMTHFRYSRYAFSNPYFFLHHWGKPVFTALTSPFAQFGYNGIKLFNVLAGTAAAWFTFRTAKLFRLKHPVVAIFLVISSPLYTMLMLSGMTEVLFSLLLIVSIFLFFKKQYIWSALILSFIPFVRNEGVVIMPLFLVAYIWQKQWKALPFMVFGFLFYSIAGSFHFKDILWVIHEMPYTGSAREFYGSGELLHYVKASKYTFGIGLTVLLLVGGVSWVLDPFLNKKGVRKEWLLEMLVGYMPFMVYLAAHSYVWWKGLGNSVGLIRVIAAVVPPAALLGTLGWSRLMERIPLRELYKNVSLVLLSLFLLIIPFRVYDIPVPLQGTQKLVKEASEWLMESPYFQNKIYYYDPFFCHFMGLNPYDSDRTRAFVHNSEKPEFAVPDGAIVIWDAHFSPNEGGLPLERLMDHPGYRLVHVVRPELPFRVIGGRYYEICIFQRILEDDGLDNHQIMELLAKEAP